ncbi:MAG: hypothetical protein IPG62_18060, partial [Sphingomonadales bacterium]|nr:hypothetical protein [Sphingomonadales bacterium]
DQFLNSYYEEDLAAGRIFKTRGERYSGSFLRKACETIPMYSDELTSMLGGLTSWEVVTIGGQDSEGNGATNELEFHFCWSSPMSCACASPTSTSVPREHPRILR